MAKDPKDYNVSVSALWETRNGNMLSMKIDARALDKIRAALEQVEVGGKLIVKRLSEDSRSKFQSTDRAPHFFLEYITKEQVAEYERAASGAQFQNQDQPKSGL